MPLSPSPLKTEHALLGLLRERPRHGYELYQSLSESLALGEVWHLKQSQLYALLNKLERQNYVSKTIEAQDNSPPRKVFHLTSAGEAVFFEWLERPVSRGRKLRLEFLAKLYFARREGPDFTRQLLHRQRALCHTWLEREHQLLAQTTPADPYVELVHAFRIGQIEAALAWLEQCEQMLLASVEAA
jgi:DNA-binding PadR family transcriptional regulator